MEVFIRELPSMYGDHHVVEVRRILLETPGVHDVYASSSFQHVEVEYDPTEVSETELEAKLEQAGYLDPLPVPAERMASPVQENGKKAFFRHTAAHVEVGRPVRFAQNMPFSGRPLWPCPGMGVIKNVDDEEVTHG